MPRDWEHIIAIFSDRRGLSEEAREALRAFVDTHVTGETITIEPDAWSTAADTEGMGSTVLDVVDDGDAVTEPRAMPLAGERYLDLGVIGTGGMGEVRRVRDLALHRTMAMKIMREEKLGRPAAEVRFVAEAQATAQLQHPGIVPVHDIGRLPDGRWYFTMKELRGQTLHEVLWEAAKDPAEWPRRRLLEIIRAVAEAVAYGHSRGVVHRDLKPANILIGDFGEVVVLDWGLVKAIDRDDVAGPEPEEPMAIDSFATRSGALLGTPAYMAPELAEGAGDAGPPTDVYGLGTLLYEVLAGHPPYEGSAAAIVSAVRAGPPSPLSAEVPEDLRELVQEAMARDVPSRTLPAGDLVKRLNRYLDGAAKRDRALAILDEADALQPRVESRLADAETLRGEALAMARETPDWASVDDKRPIWTKEDEAVAARQEADLIGLHRLQLLRAALNEVPDLPETQERLAYVYHFCHRRAENLGNPQEAAQYELLLREHDTGGYAEYLQGDGLLTLYTEPRARAVLYRFEVEDRRTTAHWEKDLGDTPLLQVSLPMGSWMIRLESASHTPVNYPVYIRRQERWDGVPPGARHPCPVPHPGRLGPDEAYVPGGWALLGGDRDSTVPPQRCWVDGFILQTFPVTNREYVAFLDDLVLRGRGAEAAARVPRTGAGTPTYWQDEHGRHHLGLDDEGDGWQPDHPVVCVTLEDARAYAAWKEERTGHPWRLPWSDEWEKAARGVDGRRYPMGEHLDPTWANVRGCHPDMVILAGISAFPADVSPYGVRGMAGSVMDLCNDRWTHPRLTIEDGRAVRSAADADDYLVGRGGWRTADVEQCEAERQSRLSPHVRIDALGFRLARSVEDAPTRRGLDYRFTL